MKITNTFDYELTYDDILSTYPWNLFKVIVPPYSKEAAFMVDPIALESVVDHTLTEREQDVIKMYFKDGKTYKEIGAKYGLCTERIGQILRKAIKKLREPSRLSNFKMCSEFDAKTEVQAALDKVNKKDPDMHKELMSIERQDFSIRTYNCLRRAGIKSLDDLVGWTPAKLMKIRNLGAHSYDELKAILQNNGYHLPTSIDGEGWVDKPITSSFAETSSSLVE